MNFLRYDVSTNAGDVVEVTLRGNAANVFLVDNINFDNYQHGRQFKYFGGYYTRSPIVLRPPSPGHWNVIVDLGGRAGQVQASVRVLTFVP